VSSTCGSLNQLEIQEAEEQNREASPRPVVPTHKCCCDIWDSSGRKPARLPLEKPKSHEDANKAFVQRVCLPFLLSSQNNDGGWGFRSDARSRVEATAWVLLALRACGSVAAISEPVAGGFRFLQVSQLPDGAWPASPDSPQGSWTTSLACWASLGVAEYSSIVDRGLTWLCADKPGETRLWWRLLRRLLGAHRVSKQKVSCYGWSWTPGTASWVEPTSYAVIVLGSAKASRLPAVARRMKLAEAMLYDRMCDGGGWNCGNPMVYGVPGEPQVGTTAWALLALRHYVDRPENQLSVQWLEQAWPKMPSPASLALAHLALDAYGRENADLGLALRKALEASETPWDVPTAAWATLALCGSRNWLPSSSMQ